MLTGLRFMEFIFLESMLVRFLALSLCIIQMLFMIAMLPFFGIISAALLISTGSSSTSCLFSHSSATLSVLTIFCQFRS